ncbi:hypothetical protein [Paenibacillus faecalis]|uniref:hypothetical protein n=1 Tax=Paenibacillus faecalis TaxID=2079532 RepID=UPI000D0FD407|nr:hypothetical protein [Paenibacillus faecalis]
MNMKIDKDLKKNIKDVSEKCGGYLTTNLYDENRGTLPSWDSIRSKYNINFSELLAELNIKSKDEYLMQRNKVKAISNFKLLNLEFGFVSKKIYDDSKLQPSSEYISKHYGWNEIAKEANVRLAHGQYIDLNDVIEQLKETIKKLGYIPTSTEYKELQLKPSQDSLAAKNITWTDAMKKAGYRPYGKAVIVKDKVCFNEDCYRQFTPIDESEKHCDPCYKHLRSILIKELKQMNKAKLEEVCTKLIYLGNSQKNILDIFNSN